MKKKRNAYSCFLIVLIAIIFSNCVNTQKYEFVCQNTISIFMQNNGKDYYINIPIQYIGDYQINSFEFVNGQILIGDYKIMLQREDIKISIYYNEDSDDIQTIVDYLNNGNDMDSISDYFRIDAYGLFKLYYLEENGKVLISKMDGSLSGKQESDNRMNQYTIYIERKLNKNEIKNIINEYRKGNANSRFEIWYDITIDNEQQTGNGILDNFEIFIITKH